MGYKVKGGSLCSICGKRAVGRFLCRRHYAQAYRHKTLDQHRFPGPEDVFDSRYEKLESGCWEWIANHNGYGYGIFLLPGETPVRAHRYAYARIHGPIPDGMVIMHTCDNPPCVNPDHLRLGTKLDNNRDASSKGRRPCGPTHWTKRYGSISRANGRFAKVKF